MANEADLLIEAGFSDARLARESAKVIGLFKDAGTKAEKAFQSAVDSVSGSQKVKATARELDKLKREFDPLYAASKRYEAQLSRLDRAQAAGAISAKQYGAALDRLNGEFSAGATQSAESGRKFGGALQNVGFQVGDFATQVGAGTSATQALGQQLPQLLGAFGTFGSLAGAAAAIMIPLGAALVKTAFDSETLEERMKALEASTDAMQETAKLAATPIIELRDRYGDLADEVARANGAMAAFTAAQAGAQLRGAAGATAGLFPDAATPSRVYGMSDAEWAAVTEGQMRALMKATGATREEAEDLAMALRRLESANGPEAVYRDAENLLSVMSKIPGATDRLAPQFDAVAGLMGQALKQVEAQRAEVVRLREEYDKTTAALGKLSSDLSQAEAERAKASAAGKAEEVAQWDRVIAKIREMVYETRAAASETDTLFERMTKSAQGFLDQAGGFAKGFMAPDGFAARYIADRTRGSGSQNEELVRATTAAAEQLGIATKDLLSIIMLESGGRPDIRGGAGNRHIGLIQFGPEEQKKYGAAIGQTITEQMAAVVAYLKDRGVKPGMALPNVYAAVNAGQAHLTNRGDTRNGGIVDNIYDFTTGPKMRPYQNRAEGLLAAYPDVVQATNEALKEQDRLQKDSAASLKREVADRERTAEALEKARQAMSESLVSQQKAAELDRQRADQIAAINAGPGSDAEKAAAIAQVNAEMQRQITIMALMEEAKRRQVDIDALMVGSTMTYRQAIEALGQAKYDDAIASQQRADAEKNASEQLAFATEQQRTFEEGMVDAVMSVDNFGDALKRMILQLLQARIQADLMAGLFGKGPTAGSWGINAGGGLLSGLGKLLGFEGGGYTGSGARIGGVDGRGGFPAILHPNETVVDHTRGQQLGAISFAPSTSIVINGGADENARMSLMRELDRRDAALKRALPGVIADAQSRGRM